MASTNQSPFYQRAEQDFHNAKTDEERISCLEIMIKECPKHKSSEAMLRNLTTRLKKLREGLERKRKAGKSSKQGIKKAPMQCVLIGLPNCGKSTVFNILSDKKEDSPTSPHAFTTSSPILGTFMFEDAQIQIIDDAPLPSNDKSLMNSADTLLAVVDSLDSLEGLEKDIWKSPARKVYIFNKIDKVSERDLRKLRETIKSKHKNLDVFFFHQHINTIDIQKLKKKIFESFPIIRVYTKEPKKDASIEPMILKKDSTLKEVAEKILKSLSQKIKRARIWGPSSKFPGQTVGLEHQLKDKDIVEFKTL